MDKRTFDNTNRGLLATLTICHMVNDFYGLVLPFLLPTLILAFHMNFAAAGLLALVTDLLGGVLQPVAGLLGDRWAMRKSLMIYGFVAFLVGLILVGASVSYIMILAAWFVYGLGTATYHPQATNLLTGAFANAKGRAMGLHGIGGAIGNFSAPLLITLLVTYVDWRATSFLLVIPGLMAIFLIATTVSEPSTEVSQMARPQVSASLWLLALTFGLLYMMYKSFLTFLPTLLVQDGSTLTQAGTIASIMLFVGFAAQPLGGSIYDRIGGRWLFVLSSLLAIGGLVLFGISSVPRLIPILLLGAAVSATFPTSLAMASDLSTDGSVGLNVGIVFGASGVLAALTPAFTGYLADFMGLQSALEWLIVFPLAALITSLFLPEHSASAQ